MPHLHRWILIDLIERADLNRMFEVKRCLECAATSKMLLDSNGVCLEGYIE